MRAPHTCLPACPPCPSCLQVRCIETCIELCHRLKQEVGSYALMGGTGFERMDYLQVCVGGGSAVHLNMDTFFFDSNRCYSLYQTLRFLGLDQTMNHLCKTNR